jgi:hypothetical protein
VVSEDPFEVSVDSESFQLLCRELNSMVRKENASWSVDLLSGGFKFNDELPESANGSLQDMLPMITLLRRLWAYRASLVEGMPRASLAENWDEVRRLAPQWAGFAADRCAASMKSVMVAVREQDARFAEDIARLEERLLHGTRQES